MGDLSQELALTGTTISQVTVGPGLHLSSQQKLKEPCALLGARPSPRPCLPSGPCDSLTGLSPPPGLHA